MGQAAGELGAFGEAVVFLSHFKSLEDPRQAGKVLYPLDEVLLLCLLAVLAGAETFVDIARFGEKKIDLLRRFRPFVHGTPAHDHLGDIFAVLNAAAFLGLSETYQYVFQGTLILIAALIYSIVRRRAGA